MGDFNCKTECFVTHESPIMLASLFSEYGLKICDSLHKGNINYPYRCLKQNVFTWIDHAFISGKIFNSVNDVEILDSGENISDYCILGVHTSLIVPNVYTYCMPVTDIDNGNTISYIWSLSNCQNYYRKSYEPLRCMLEKMMHCSVINCNDSSCTNPCHNDSLNQYTYGIINILVEASSHCIKKTKNNKVPWNNELQLLKRASVDSHHNWVLNDKPRTGDVWCLKVKNHLEYKNAIKEARSQSKKIFSDKLLYRLMAKNTNSF